MEHYYLNWPIPRSFSSTVHIAAALVGNEGNGGVTDDVFWGRWVELMLMEVGAGVRPQFV